MPSARPAPPPPPTPADDAPSSPKTGHHPSAPSSDPGPSPADAPADEKSTHPADPSDSAGPAGIDMETFSQIRDLDEEDDYEFSKGMAWAYFDQAATTFEDMDKAYVEKDLAKLSSLGHFLKGSSAALGVSKVQASCERVQHYGDLRDEEMDKDLTQEEALAKINATLARVKVEYEKAEKWLKSYYDGLA